MWRDERELFWGRLILRSFVTVVSLVFTIFPFVVIPMIPVVAVLESLGYGESDRSVAMFGTQGFLVLLSLVIWFVPLGGLLKPRH